MRDFQYLHGYSDLTIHVITYKQATAKVVILFNANRILIFEAITNYNKI